jgi:hypothetical protein
VQLTTTIAQPPTANVAPATMPTAVPLMRADPAMPAEPDPAPASATSPAPQSDAGLGAKLLGGLASKQQRSIQNQQVLALISQQLAERISLIGSHAWSFLRGTARADSGQ